MRAQVDARGVTLVELLVVLVLLGIMAGVVGLTLHTARPAPPTDSVGARITTALDSAIRLGHLVTIEVRTSQALLAATALPDEKILLVEEALQELKAEDTEKAQVVMLKFFAGLTNEQTAEAMNINERTVRRQWSFAKAWLFDRIAGKH